MKKILLFADADDKKAVEAIDSTEKYFLCKFFDEAYPQKYPQADFALIDTDKYTNCETIISPLKQTDTKIWGYTKKLERSNILNLYQKGFDNIIETPKDYNYTFRTMVNPDNLDVKLSTQPQAEDTKKILFVSSNSIEAELLFQIFNEFNYVYTLKANKETAIAELETNNYDLIIIDNSISESERFAIINYIETSRLNNNTPFIFISTTSKDVEKLKSYNLGAIAFLEKPYNINIIKAQIKNILKVKELQNKLFKESNILNNIIKFSSKQPIITDKNFNIITAGEQYIKVFPGENILKVFENQNIRYPKPQIDSFINEPPLSIKFVFTTKENTYEIEITKIFSNDRILENYLILIEDITEKLNTEEQKETFIATLSHDLKAPIRAEANILQQILDGKFGQLNENQAVIINEIINSRKTTRRMLDNILTRYRITANQFDIFPSKYNYTETITTAINSAMYMIEAKQQELKFSYKAKTKQLIYDQTAIIRVIVNLLANASEYTPSKGQISIEIEESDTQMITSITDTGYGIEEKDLKHIFDKNVTLAKKYRKVGSGLGLYISKSIIEAHGGEITVKSTPNIGSIFTFTLNKKAQLHQSKQ